jgi:hypothetical protein
MNQVIAVSGKKGTGKDEFYKIASKYIKEKYDLEYENKKFADRLKQICSFLTGIPLDHWYDRKYYDDVVPLWDITIRQFMQQLGTEAIRDKLNVNSWVYSLFSELDNDSRWLITDLRFQNEAKFLYDRNFIKIRVNRPGVHGDDKHRSEIDLDNYNHFDFVIQNDGTLEEYEQKIHKIIDMIYVEEL